MKKIIFILLLVFFSAAGYVHAGEKVVIGDKERLIATNVSKGRSVQIKWCGNEAFLLRTGSGGIFRLDINTKEQVLIVNDEDVFSNQCTPDGKWVLYERIFSAPNPGYAEYDGPYVNLYMPKIMLEDIYLYEVATGNTHKLARTNLLSTGSGWLSPDGKKILLGAQYRELFKTPGPAFEPVWFSDGQWDSRSTEWLSDSSGAATTRSDPYGIEVELFGANKKIKQYLHPDDGGSISDLYADRNSGIYFDSIMHIIPGSDSVSVLSRCTVEGDEFICKKFFENSSPIASFEILSDGDIIFDELYWSCIHRATPGQPGSECLFNPDLYRDIRLIGVSPDGKQLAFQENPHRKPQFYYNLFVIELKNNN